MNELTIIDQLALIAQSAKAEYQSVLTCACLCAACVMALVAIAYASRGFLGRVRRFVHSIGPVGCAIVGPFATVLVMYGSTKWRFEYINGVHDNGSYCTNDQICAAWTYDEPTADYTLKAQYQDLTITNEVGECVDQFHALEDGVVKEGERTWTVANATNMRVVVWAKYVPPPVVHTNGVYHLSGVMRTMDEDGCKFVTPGVRILVRMPNGQIAVLTPTNAPPPVSTLLTTNREDDQE